jgi:hypothetical protein
MHFNLQQQQKKLKYLLDLFIIFFLSVSPKQKNKHDTSILLNHEDLAMGLNYCYDCILFDQIKGITLGKFNL